MSLLLGGQRFTVSVPRRFPFEESEVGKTYVWKRNVEEGKRTERAIEIGWNIIEINERKEEYIYIQRVYNFNA